MRDVYQTVMAYARRHHMFSPGDTVVVAVSGGSDSVALLHLLCRLAPRWQLQLHAGHLNHLLRGEEAEEDARFVAQLAASLGVPITVGREDVAARAASRRLGLEEAGREARYEFLEHLAQRVGARRIALGHTRDDQAETVLMRLLRGAGVEGLAGIPPVRGTVVRPLLAVGRAELQEYCRAQGLSWRTDPYNLDLSYLRNRVRHRLLPGLEEVAGPRVRERLAELAEVLRPDVEWLREVEGETLSRVASRRGENLVLDPGVLAALHPALRRRVIRRAVLAVKGPGRQLGWGHVQAVLDLLGEYRLAGRPDSPGEQWEAPVDGPGAPAPTAAGALEGETHLPGGVVARLGPEGLVIGREGGERAVAYRYHLPVPGLVEVPEAGLVISAGIVREGEWQRADIAGEGEWQRAVAPGGGERLARRAVLDYNKTGAVLLVRSWRPGDRFFPLGMESPKKIHDFFVDEKVPRVQRQRIPLVLSGDQIVWVVGYRIDHRFRVTPATRDVLVLEAHGFEDDQERGA
ncbi:MAG: tRNA lysidine(34) synthetase TilS [Firmicutes bacterium]|nr:tRNA lysidine(34) synthetase TilS [Bacillota bacterium]